MFAFQDTRGGVDVAFTDRHRPAGDGPDASLDLAEGDPRDPGTLWENIDLVARALASDREAPPAEETAHASHVRAGRTVPVVVRMRQVHGADVHVVDRDLVRPPHAQPPIVADALVTDQPGVALMVRVADCVPVLLADVAGGIVGAAHAGRPGMVAGVVPNTVEAMRGLGAGPLVAWVGPHVCGRCYEVPHSMRDEVSAVVPQAYAETSWGTPAVDVGAGVRAQLAEAGVEVVDAARCTMEDDALFSYRRQGSASGRMAGLVWVRP